MLVSVSIKNFRNFEDWFEVDLRTAKNYEFNTHTVDNGIVKHALIYGRNGGGKSNLGLAMLDITCHLNDISSNSSLDSLNSNYLNGNSANDLAEFVYLFNFSGVEVKYSYGKSSVNTPIYERLEVNNHTVVNIDRRNSGITSFALGGTESLKNDLSSSPISALKYVNSNALLDDSLESNSFKQLIAFVKGMVFFRTLNKRSEHHGVEVEAKRISKEIINADKLGDFEQFLNDAGVECRLVKIGATGDEKIAFVFDGKHIEFSQVASSGTLSLGIFYFWWLKLNNGELTFAYIDEFDAFYHHKLSKMIVKKLSQLQCQTILTTHNTSIMSNDLLRPDCYFEVRGNVAFKDKGLPLDKMRNKPGLYPFYSLVEKELRKAHNLEKIYKGLDNG